MRVGGEVLVEKAEKADLWVGGEGVLDEKVEKTEKADPPPLQFFTPKKCGVLFR